MATDPANILVTLPYDIIFQIFQKVGVGNAMCMGLTCRQLYAYFKTYHPGLVDLDCRIHQPGCDFQKDGIKNKCDPRERWNANCYSHTSYGLRFRSCIGVLANTFFRTHTCESITKGYRMSYEAERHPRMLNLKVYGGFEYPRAEQFRINEKRLTDRYRDWSNAYLDTGGYPDGRGLILPCPHNLGEDWYPQAFKATVKNYDDFCFVREWKINWRNFTFVEEQESELDAALDEHLWRLCAEGLALLGF